MGQKEDEERVDSTAFQTVILVNIRDLLRKTIPRGISDEIKDLVSSTQIEGAIYSFEDNYGGPLFSVSIRNDGPGIIYYGVNKKVVITPNIAQVNANEKADLSYNSAIIRFLNIKTTTTANIRLYVLG